MESLFNLGTKTNSSSEAIKEGVHYKNWDPKKTGLPYKIFNFDNEELCPTKGIIHLESYKVSKNVNGHRRHKTSIKFDRVYDSATGIIIGIPVGYDEKNDRPIFKSIHLEEDNYFNLANPEDAKTWAVVKNSYFVEGSPNAHDKKMIIYRVHDKEKEADLYNAKREIKRKAERIADGLHGKQLLETAIQLGFNVDDMSPSIMSMKVSQVAESEPKRFMDVWDSPNKLEITIIKRALSTAIITEDIQLGYMYGAIQLGISEALAVEYLKDHPQIRVVIDQQSQAKQSDSIKAMSDVTTAPIADDKDAEIARLKAELAKSNKAVKEVSEVKGEEIAENLTFNLADNERKELLEEAKHFKLNGAHKQDNDKIRARIAEAKAKIEVAE
jgi:hypothetical protein